MALAEGMKNLVDDLKASRHSRHEFVKGNREMTRALQQENRNFLGDIHNQNQMLARQTRDFMISSREERKASFKQTMDVVRADIDVVRQAKSAIVQGAQAMIKEFRDDSALAHKYWQSLSTDEPVEEPTAVQRTEDNANATKNKGKDKKKINVVLSNTGE